MTLCFQLLPNPNAYYQQALRTLAVTELDCMLRSLGIAAEIAPRVLGGADFLCFDAALTDGQLATLSRHSSLLLMAEEKDGLLLPLDVPRPVYLPRDCAEIPKYKGKTGTTFTRMLLNLALSASGSLEKPRTTVLDPMCGRGTGLFVALESGCDAVGADVDTNDLRECMNWFSRYMTHGRFKHSLRQDSLTGPEGGTPRAVYTFADTKEHDRSGDTRTLTLLNGDTATCARLLKKTRADALICDLPYGIQHAPQRGRRPEDFGQLLFRALPAWRDALRKGGAMAVSFNVLTLPRNRFIALAEAAGLTVLNEAPYGRCEHFVEQAVHRDILVCRRDD